MKDLSIKLKSIEREDKLRETEEDRSGWVANRTIVQEELKCLKSVGMRDGGIQRTHIHGEQKVGMKRRVVVDFTQKVKRMSGVFDV